jgi:hypothetical protein
LVTGEQLGNIASGGKANITFDMTQGSGCNPCCGAPNSYQQKNLPGFGTDNE